MALPTDNLRKLRRFMQGAGVNMRRAYCTGVDNAPDVGTRTLVPGLTNDSAIISITGYVTATGVPLGDISGEYFADRYDSTTINDEVVNAGLIWTTKVNETVRVRYVNPGANSSPLNVVVDKTTAGVARITVNLSTDGGGSLNATATLVRAAVLQHPEAGKLVNIVLVGGDTGAGLSTAVTEFPLGTDPDGTTSAPVTGYHNKIGGRRAVLTLLQTGNADYQFEAKRADQLAYDLAIVVAGMNTPFSVTYSAPNITINLATDGAGVATTTAKQLVDGFNADPDVNGLFVARLIPSPYGNDGSALAVAVGAQAFTVGQTPGIILSDATQATGVDHATTPHTIIVDWFEPAHKAGEIIV